MEAALVEGELVDAAPVEGVLPLVEGDLVEGPLVEEELVEGAQHVDLPLICLLQLKLGSHT